MRLSFALLAVAILLPATASAAPRPGAAPAPQPACTRATRQVAEQPALEGGQRPSMRKLSDLPSGRAYMAVYRQIGGCEAPLTLVDYRSGGHL